MNKVKSFELNNVQIYVNKDINNLFTVVKLINDDVSYSKFSLEYGEASEAFDFFVEEYLSETKMLS